VRKSDSDHATPTLFAMPVLCSVEATQAFARKGAVIVRAEVSGNVGMLVVSRLFAQSFAVGAGLLGTGSSTNAIGRARRMFHAERR
jgi:hypothetical protein